MPFLSAMSCDRCDACIVYAEVQNKSTMEFLARRRGWSVGKELLCPDCRTTPVTSRHYDRTVADRFAEKG